MRLAAAFGTVLSAPRRRDNLLPSPADRAVGRMAMVCHDVRRWGVTKAVSPAIIMTGSGAQMSYARFVETMDRVSQLLAARGLGPGDAIAVLTGNDPMFLAICLGARCAGVDYTPVARFLRPQEIAYIVRNSAAQALFVSHDLLPLIAEVDRVALRHAFVIGGDAEGLERFETMIAAHPATAPADLPAGREMLYSSGTTGRPKGVRILADTADARAESGSIAALMRDYGFGPDTVNLTPAPLHHAAPLRYCTHVAAFGGLNLIMERFDAEEMLAAIERYRVTHTELVPTMMVRLLKLSAEVRARYDISSLRFVSHAGAPCPPDVKHRMIDWFGPIIHETYGGSEANGLCRISASEWLTHPGSVGRAVVGALHILDDCGHELPAGEIGTIYFEGGSRFEYHDDPEKTAAAFEAHGWSTLGDMGHVDAEGFLYLADRRSNMIISGGVNIYPQEAENILIAHDDVEDIAVFGIPDDEYGEVVAGIAQLRDMSRAGPDLERDLIAYCRSQIASLKCPLRISFVPKLPRDDTGKIYKQRLREQFVEVAGPPG